MRYDPAGALSSYSEGRVPAPLMVVLVPKTQGPAHQRILIETSRDMEIEVDIRAEAALIQAGFQLLSELPSSVDRKQ